MVQLYEVVQYENLFVEPRSWDDNDHARSERH
jgi:hypothetical protein